jgi:hypothetical protein
VDKAGVSMYAVLKIWRKHNLSSIYEKHRAVPVDHSQILII